jgi:NAD(P)-dependent dehydrogenase (short-subunit alcohol dehydrogenase family)
MLGYVEIARPHVPVTDVVRNMLVGTSVTGQATMPYQVAALVSYLSSDDAANLTGQIIPLEGGTTIHADTANHESTLR